MSVNVATGLAKFGRETALLACIGEDESGDRVLTDLAAGPVDDRLVRREPGVTTHCIIPRDPAGDRMILTTGDSTARLRIRDVDRPVLEAADAVFAPAYTPDPATSDLLDVAADGGPRLAAAMNCRVEGARGGLATRAAVREFLDGAPPTR